MNDLHPILYIVDDDEAVADSLGALAQAAGYQVVVLNDPRELLAMQLARHGCIICDLRMPHIDGLQLQQMLSSRQVDLPLIFITAHGEVASAVQALRKGAIDYLQKPFDDIVLLERIDEALSRHAARLSLGGSVVVARRQIALLTPREREIAGLIADGLSSKRIALRLDISARTVETHRAHIYDKLGINSTAQLARLVYDSAARYEVGGDRISRDDQL